MRKHGGKMLVFHESVCAHVKPQYDMHTIVLSNFMDGAEHRKKKKSSVDASQGPVTLWPRRLLHSLHVDR